MWYQTCGKMAKIVRKITYKKIVCKIPTFMGVKFCCYALCDTIYTCF